MRASTLSYFLSVQLPMILCQQCFTIEGISELTSEKTVLMIAKKIKLINLISKYLQVLYVNLQIWKLLESNLMQTFSKIQGSL